MSKSVMISIRPEWVEKILKGEKTIEVRKSYPTDFKDTLSLNIFDPSEKTFKVYIYCTQGIGLYNNTGTITRDPVFIVDSTHRYMSTLNRKVVAEFTCDAIDRFWNEGDYDVYKREHWEKYTGLSLEEIDKYANGKDVYLWHISDLKIYDEPKSLEEFGTLCSWCKYRNIYKCKMCDNVYAKEDRYGREYGARKLTRPFQSWGYVKEWENI